MANQDKYIRKVQTAVNIFLSHQGHYLLLERNLNKRIDPGKLNAIGGKLEPGEDFLKAAIRETEEETGLVLRPTQLHFSGLIRLEGGYDEDWIVCVFTAEVSDKKIPKGNQTEDGKLMWIDKDAVLDSDYQLIDDLKYYFKDIVEKKDLFFVNATMNKEEKVEKLSISRSK